MLIIKFIDRPFFSLFFCLFIIVDAQVPMVHSCLLANLRLEESELLAYSPSKVSVIIKNAFLLSSITSTALYYKAPKCRWKSILAQWTTWSCLLCLQLSTTTKYLSTTPTIMGWAWQYFCNISVFLRCKTKLNLLNEWMLMPHEVKLCVHSE